MAWGLGGKGCSLGMLVYGRGLEVLKVLGTDCGSRWCEV